MNSCLYECQVMHQRFSPKPHRFSYNYFSFYLDLDELDTLHEASFWISARKLNLFSFYEEDHFLGSVPSLKNAVIEYLRSQEVWTPISKVFLFTHLRVLGYVFNPVSFYYCFDEEDRPVCVIAEVGNTFKEMKPYLLRLETLQPKGFEDEQKKYFYVSPFLALTDDFRFQIGIPGQTLQIAIDTLREGKPILISRLQATAEPLTSSNLIWNCFRFPWVTLKVITAIHWQAFKLYLKKIPYHPKNENSSLQKGVHHV